jgi:hypothetical protein
MSRIGVKLNKKKKEILFQMEWLPKVGDMVY